jgi:DNA mismatch repair protein MutS
VARCDVLAGLAEVARRSGWCRPELDDSTALELVECRHPVVEEVVGAGQFVANDCILDAAAGAPARARLAVITGPNMAGKSTYIRQVALAVILAQAGSFVPAARARIGLVDRVFTRVGAGDELARGQSTFMVEMAETAAILHHATRRSLVVLDEVGRGTSTFDGVSLAWAITEHLHDRIACRALFATHYHELTDLAADRPGIANLTVAVAEQDEEVVFLHRIVAGAATKSYGIHVARLAGVPRTVVARAREVLSTLEQLNVGLQERERPVARAPGGAGPVQLTLFQAAESATLNRLKALDLDQITPRQALDLLDGLQRDAKRE